MEISVEVIRSDRRSVSLEIRPDGVVLVRAPLRMGTPRLRAFVEANRGWIEDKLQKLAAQPRAERLSGEELAALKKDARRVFSDRAAHFAPLLGVKFGRITVRCQKSKWGSCSAKGNLNFNCLLLLAPGEVLDYVVVHELCQPLRALLEAGGGRAAGLRSAPPLAPKKRRCAHGAPLLGSRSQARGKRADSQKRESAPMFYSSIL